MLEDNNGHHQKICQVSFAQQQMWLLDRLDPGNAAYNIARALRIRGSLSAEVLTESLRSIAARHESLRTTFYEFDGEPVQVITAGVNVDFPILDLSELTESQREAETLRLARQEAQRPFDLAKGPLLRATLLRLKSDEHVFIIVMHHIVTDAWSMSVLFREIGQFYETLALGRPSRPPDLPIQYGEFARRQRDLQKGEDFDRHLAYWRSQLAGVDPVLDLPSDLIRPAVRTSAGANERVVFPTELMDGLKELSREANATLFMTLLAAFQVLLSRYTGHDDLVVGSPTAGRNEVELEPLIGFFVNTLVLRSDLSGNPTFRELLGRVREVALDAYAHQDVPVEKVIDQVQVPRSLSHSPLFQVMFILQNAPKQIIDLAGLTLEELEFDSGTAKFDLTVEMAEMDEGLACAVEYNTDVIEQTVVLRMLGHFQMLLQSVVDDPGRRVLDFSLMDEEERRRLVVEWNDTAEEYHHDKCIHTLFEDQVERTPSAAAVTDRTRTVTYLELNNRTNKLAHYLRRRGVARGAIVAVFLERSIEAVESLLAVMKTGAAYLPIDPSYPLERVSFMLEDSRAITLLTVRGLSERIPKSASDVICLDVDWETVAHENDTNPETSVNSEEPAYVIYTSGSTGRPKGVVGPHLASVNRFAWMWNAFRFAPNEVCCQKTALSFVDSVWEIFGPLLQGVPSVIIPEEELGDPDRMVRTLAENRVSRIVLVPSMLRFLLENVPDLRRKVPELKLWITSGETIAPALARRFEQTLPDARLVNLYGSSEVAGDVTSYLIQRGSAMNRVPIGRPIANAQIYVLDRALNPAPTGVAGEIYVGGDNVARGYLNNLELTSQKFIPDPFAGGGGRLYRTGDLGRFRFDGNLEFLGRVDSQVKIRGIRIELGEIESVLVQHPSVRAAAVIVSGDHGDERLAGYLVCDQGMIDESEIRRFLRAKLPEHLVPSWFVAMEALPLTPNGKVDRRALMAHDRTQQESQRAYVAPRNATETRLAGIVTEVLGIERASIHDNFFELGGHSLRGMQVIARIRKLFHVELPLRTLFDEPTVAGLSVEIDKAKKLTVVTEIVASNKKIELMSRERLLARLNELSDSQIEALLSSMPRIKQDDHDSGDM